ncbi:MAG: hypothetical protein EBR59_09510 [Methylococcaceae bacterium]|jgi:hypothetical protein|nr:hypothetical protein [Methylococcaceae bacterium]
MIESILATTALVALFNWKFSFLSFDTKVFEKPISQENKPEANGLLIPEDSTLRRHFISKLRYEIEASLPPRPLEKNLLDHHQSIVDSQLEKALAGLPIEAAD